jgi:hypothetical protein
VKVKHTFKVTAKCPVDGSTDVYECTATFRQVIPCEQLVLFGALGNVAAYQEEVTQILADKLGAKVRTIGHHVKGEVKTVCVCRPRSPVQTGLPQAPEGERVSLPGLSMAKE